MYSSCILYDGIMHLTIFVRLTMSDPHRFDSGGDNTGVEAWLSSGTYFIWLGRIDCALTNLYITLCTILSNISTMSLKTSTISTISSR